MLRPKKNSYKEFDNENKFLQLKNSPPPPHNFSNGPSLTSMYKMYKFFTFWKTYKSVDVSVPSCQLQLDIWYETVCKTNSHDLEKKNFETFPFHFSLPCRRSFARQESVTNS